MLGSADGGNSLASRASPGSAPQQTQQLCRSSPLRHIFPAPVCTVLAQRDPSCGLRRGLWVMGCALGDVWAQCRHEVFPPALAAACCGGVLTHTFLFPVLLSHHFASPEPPWLCVSPVHCCCCPQVACAGDPRTPTTPTSFYQGHRFAVCFHCKLQQCKQLFLISKDCAGNRDE